MIDVASCLLASAIFVLAGTAWFDAMRRATAAQIATELGIAVHKQYGQRCLACDSERPVRYGRLAGGGNGGIGFTTDLRGWKCFRCGASGDALDLVSLALCGRPFRDTRDHERAQVREWCMRFTGVPAQGSASRVFTRAPALALPDSADDGREREAPDRPPLDQLQRLWRQCTTRCDMTPEFAEHLRRQGDLNPAAAVGLSIALETAEYIRRQRNLDPTSIADAGLAIAFVRDDRALSFARVWDRNERCWLRWAAHGYTLLLKLYDHLGVARSVIARCVRTPRADLTKSASPQGFKRTRLIMANGLAQQMLRHGVHPSMWPAATGNSDPFPLESAWWPAGEPFCLVIAEGEIDFLSWCTSSTWSDANPFAPGVLGIVSGSWSRDFAERIPIGTHLTISQQPGEAGERYTQEILATLAGRNDLDVTVWRAPVVPEVL